MTARFLPPFIPDQLWSILVTDADPQPFLTTRHFRTGRASGIADHEENPWQILKDSDRRALVNGTFSANDNGAARLIAFVADAGVGKTCSTEFAAMTFNTPGGGGLAVSIKLADLCSQPPRSVGDWLRAELKDSIQRSLKEKSTDAVLNRMIDRQLHRGRLMIVLDALDQVGDSRSLEAVLKDPAWQSCRFVISARPYAIQRDWKHLFTGRDWTYVRLEEFDEEQQELFLGSLSDGESRWKRIPEEARKILGVPRVLLYLLKVEEDRLNALRTAADIFNFAIDRLIEEGLTQSADARRIACDPASVPAKPQDYQIARARELLAMIAYHMTLSNDPKLKRPPNFNRIQEGRTFRTFQQRLAAIDGQEGFHQDLQSMAALNNFLEHGLFDTDHTDLREMQFSNRSLQEFFCAEYMATHDVSKDYDIWWRWQSLPHDEESQEFYQIWQFLCDLPDEALDNNNPVPWLRAIQPLYRPGDGTVAGTRRSTEMIFRSWGRLNDWRLAGQELAQEICDTWLGEFEGILNGTELGTTPERQQAARDLTESFLTLKPGTFKMGASEAHQRQIREPTRRYFANWLKRTLDAGDWEAGLNAETTDRFYDRTAADRRWLKFRRGYLQQALIAEQTQVGTGLELLMLLVYPMNETPAGNCEQTITHPLTLSRMPTINAWYRLFEPGHGVHGTQLLRDEYQKISQGLGQPVIHVSWFDAWAFSLWAHWDNQSCRLPWEFEWEYCAKYGLPEDQWDQRYWWGDEEPTKENGFANVKGIVGRTNEPNPQHANPSTKAIDPKHLGLMDQLGNVNEWCQDVYRRVYSWNAADFSGDPSSNRVLRGGSWYNNPLNSRCAFRFRNAPDDRNYISGFRLSRTP